MNKLYALLFVLLIILACGPAKAQTDNTVHFQGTKVSYDSVLMPETSEVLALVNFNHVSISAPEGTQLDYKVDMGTVTVSGNGTNSMTVDLITGPAQVQILVTKCADVCPTLVHFLHEVVYDQ